MEHEYWKEKLAEFMRQKGLTVEKERPIGGGQAMDIAVSSGDRMFAVEIETGNSDAVSNIEKDLAAGAEYVLTVATSGAAQKQIEETLAEKNLSGDDRVRVLSVSSLDLQ